MQAVLITGASTGIGKGCAEYLAHKGFKVYAGVRSDSAFTELDNLHANIEAVKLDILIEDSISAAVEHITAKEKDNSYFALVNNAGVVKAGPIEFVTPDELRSQMEINLIAQVNITQKLLPFMRTKQEARIIFNGSISGLFASPLNAPYAASKHAMEAIADGFRRELATNSAIKVSLLEPGQINTPIWEKSLKHANEISKTYPPGFENLYGELLSKVSKRVHLNTHENPYGPDVVAECVYHALTNPKPKSRYLMGKGAKFAWFLSKLPDSWCDAIIKKKLDLKKCH